MKKVSLMTWIIMATISGIALGVFAPGFAVQLQFISNIFIRLIKSIIAPLIFSSLVYGIAKSGSVGTMGRIGVALSVLQWFGRPLCLALGGAIVAGHNLLDPIWPASKLIDQQWPMWVALHSQMALHAGPFLFRFVYPPLAWSGVMSLGFGISGVFELTPARREAI